MQFSCVREKVLIILVKLTILFLLQSDRRRRDRSVDRSKENRIPAKETESNNIYVKQEPMADPSGQCNIQE